MTDTFAVIVERPDHAPVPIGPFIARKNAERYAQRLDGILRESTTHAATVYTDIANPQHEHLDPRLPTEPWSLGDLAEKEDEEDFPGLFLRLCAQLGEDIAEEVWDKVDDWAKDSVGDKREELTAVAEDWRSRREESTGALERIAVELWRDGLRNVRRIGQITSLSRTTLYAALREAGIEPTDRRAARNE
ncbi:hypothetical protein [Streptomyces antimycoticus]|uniref:hypothetical protein n=1 Tax=Streptomyces antimycoticus TaxID=68175 RepID=UPI0036EA193D|nr:hypothetical protein OG751_03800 [Streptomyces antimycoticus]